MQVPEWFRSGKHRIREKRKFSKDFQNGKRTSLRRNKPRSCPPLKPQKTTRKKTKSGTVDIGKMVALRNAGWTYKQIAEEMKLTEKQVSNYLYNAKKREKK
ncbi:hypothetical protein GPK66_04425 [Eubacterium ramulus]|nr:hypothetical protein [Eubacterium ramulus]